MQLENQDGSLEEIDLGYVGEIKKVAPGIIISLLDQGYIPVISPIAGSEDGESYNVNADTAAGILAGALKADKLLILTDVKGVLKNINDPASLISVIARDEVPSLISEGVIQGGMIPKVECAVEALQQGTGSVHIIDGRQSHAILLELFTDGGIGTMLV